VREPYRRSSPQLPASEAHLSLVSGIGSIGKPAVAPLSLEGRRTDAPNQERIPRYGFKATMAGIGGDMVGFPFEEPGTSK